MKTVLIVDDRAINRQFLASLLGYFQYRVIEASDGVEALEIARADRPDLIIADILMPRMDGFDLAKRVRADPSLAGVVMMFYSASYRMAEALRLASECGVGYAIGKPAEPELILRTVAEALGEPVPLQIPSAAGDLPGRPPTDWFTEKFLRTVESLECTSLRLSAIIKLCLELTGERNPDRLLDKVCIAARDVLSARYAVAHVERSAAERVRGFAVCGYDADTEALVRSAAERGELLRELPTSAQPIRRTRASNVPGALGLPAMHPPVQSLLAISLHLGDRELGWVLLADKVGRASFNEEDERIAETLGALAAVAYENACLFDEVKEHAGKLRLEMVERGAAQDALKAREAQLAGLAANHPGVLYQRVQSRNGAVSFPFVSDRAYEMFGYAPHEIAANPSLLTAAIAPEHRDAVRRAIERSSRELSAMELDFRFTARNGEDKWARTISVPRRLPDGDTVWDGLILDISHQKHLEGEQAVLERRLQQAHKLEAVGRLTGGMAHDFNNLLQVMLGNFDVLAERLRGDAQNAELAQAGAEAAQRGADLIKALLAFSRRQPLEPSAFDAGALITSTMRLLGQTLGEEIEISLAIAPDLWPIFADVSQLESAIANLAVNARDAMPHGGRLAVGARNVSVGADDAGSGATPGDYVLIEVTDTGCGMSAAVQARAFDPFFSTKEEGKGTGLGLSMIYGFAEQSGGHVSLSSEEGRGTTVRLYMPRARHTALPSQAAQAGDRAVEGRGEHILLVDDRADVRRSTAMVLSRLGYNVLAAEGPQQAFEILMAEKSIDLLFTDVVMPGGMSGAELARQATARHPGLKVLFTSGFPEALTSAQRDLPASHYLAKPYRGHDLARKLREVLSVPQAQTRATGNG